MVLGRVLLPDDFGGRRHQKFPEQLPHVLLPRCPGRLHARTSQHLILVPLHHGSKKVHLEHVAHYSAEHLPLHPEDM